MNAFQEAPQGKKNLTLAAILIASVVLVTQSTSLSTLLSVAAQEVGGLDIFSMTATINGAFTVVFMSLFGYMAFRKPALQPKILIVCLFLATIGIAIRAMAPSMEIIIVTAVIYSVISGAVFVCGYSMIRMMFDAAKAGLYLGFASTCSLIGSLVGTPLVGVISDLAGWRIAYHVMWVLFLLTAILALFGVKITSEQGKSLERDLGKFDVLGAFGLTVFSIAIILFLSLGSSRVPFGSIPSFIILAVAAVGLIILIADIRSKGARAIIPAVVLKDKTTVLITLQAMCAFFASMAIAFFMATYIIYVMQKNATQATLATTMFSLAGVVLSPILGRWLGKTRKVKQVLVSGALVRCIVMVALIFLIQPNINIIVVYVVLVVYGMATCVDNISSSVIPQMAIKEDLRIASNSFISTCRTFSANMGTAVYGVMIATLGVAGGIKPAFWVSLGAGVLSLLLAFAVKNPKAEEVSK